MSEQLFIIDVLFGVKELQTRLRPESPNRIVGEGRSRIVDRAGLAGPWTEWTPTGVVMVWGDEQKPRKTLWFRWIYDVFASIARASD